MRCFFFMAHEDVAPLHEKSIIFFMWFAEEFVRRWRERAGSTALRGHVFAV